MPEPALPLAHKARLCGQRIAAADRPWQKDLTSLAFTTVAEISIAAYLDLMAKDQSVQPISRVTATLHNRDEYCHSSIASEIAKGIYFRLDDAGRRFFRAALADGLEAFAANDFTTWHAIVRLAGLDGGAQMLDDVAHDPARKRLLQDFSGLYRLCGEMEILDEVPFDWSTVATTSPGEDPVV
jgi:alpha-N-dichloroacetyl-p-aminophenylserinol N-oxygenase